MEGLARTWACLLPPALQLSVVLEYTWHIFRVLPTKLFLPRDLYSPLILSWKKMFLQSKVVSKHRLCVRDTWHQIFTPNYFFLLTVWGWIFIYFHSLIHFAPLPFSHLTNGAIYTLYIFFFICFGKEQMKETVKELSKKQCIDGFVCWYWECVSLWARERKRDRERALC